LYLTPESPQSIIVITNSTSFQNYPNYFCGVVSTANVQCFQIGKFLVRYQNFFHSIEEYAWLYTHVEINNRPYYTTFFGRKIEPYIKSLNNHDITCLTPGCDTEQFIDFFNLFLQIGNERPNLTSPAVTIIDLRASTYSCTGIQVHASTLDHSVIVPGMPHSAYCMGCHHWQSRQLNDVPNWCICGRAQSTTIGRWQGQEPRPWQPPRSSVARSATTACCVAAFLSCGICQPGHKQPTHSHDCKTQTDRLLTTPTTYWKTWCCKRLI